MDLYDIFTCVCVWGGYGCIFNCVSMRFANGAPCISECEFIGVS